MPYCGVADALSPQPANIGTVLFGYLVAGFAFWGANSSPIVNHSREMLSEVENDYQP
jgi:hypothetical protein